MWIVNLFVGLWHAILGLPRDDDDANRRYSKNIPGEIWYGDYLIEPSPYEGDKYMFSHRDYDWTGDYRFGHGDTVEICKMRIDIMTDDDYENEA